MATNFAKEIPYALPDQYGPDPLSQSIGRRNVLQQSGWGKAVKLGLMTEDQALNMIYKGEFTADKFMRNYYKDQYNLAAKNNDTKAMSESLSALQGIDSKINPTSKLGKLEKGLGIANTVIGGVVSLGELGLGIANAVYAGDMIKQAKEKFEFEKGLVNRNIENTGKLINEQVAARANLAGIYGAKNSGGYSYARDKYYDKNSVNTKPIG